MTLNDKLERIRKEAVAVATFAWRDFGKKREVSVGRVESTTFSESEEFLSKISRTPVWKSLISARRTSRWR
jgi:hypothetical protein